MNGFVHPLSQYIPQQLQRQQAPAQQQMSGARAFQNPLQRLSYIMQAMRNPAAFVRQNLPGIPEQAFNDPTGNGVLQYMQQNMGVTAQDIQNAAN